MVDIESLLDELEKNIDGATRAVYGQSNFTPEQYAAKANAVREKIRTQVSENNELIDRLVACVDLLMPGGKHLALSGDDIMLLNETLIAARKP